MALGLNEIFSGRNGAHREVIRSVSMEKTKGVTKKVDRENRFENPHRVSFKFWNLHNILADNNTY